MTAETTHREQAENVGAYALGALPELEAHVFERHLMACDECQQELRRLSEAVEALPRSVAAHAPPPSLKAGLMDVVQAEAAARHPVRRRRPWLRLPPMRPAVAWAAAAVVIATGAGFGAGALVGDDGGSRELRAQVDRQRLPGASATLRVPEDQAPGSVLQVDGLPDPGRDRVYQVWVERDGTVEPGPVFAVDTRGSGAAAVTGSLEDASAVMVTREPRGGSLRPSEAPVLRVDV